MGVSKYVARGKVRWRVDTYVTLPDGATRRIRKKRIPTREQAEVYERKMLVEASEGRLFDRVKEPTATVRELWAEYEPITKRDNDSWRSDVGLAAHLMRLLGDRRASRLNARRRRGVPDEAVGREPPARRGAVPGHAGPGPDGSIGAAPAAPRGLRVRERGHRKPWQDVKGAVERARTKAGLEGVWVHDLRRSFATLSRRSGLPESVVARFSGHRTAAVFKRYNIVEEQDLKAAVQVLNRVRASTPPAGTDGHDSDTAGEK